MITIDTTALKALVYEAVCDAMKAQAIIKAVEVEQPAEMPKTHEKVVMKYDDFMDELRSFLREQDDTSAATAEAKRVCHNVFGTEKFKEVEEEDLSELLRFVKTAVEGLA